MKKVQVSDVVRGSLEEWRRYAAPIPCKGVPGSAHANAFFDRSGRGECNGSLKIKKPYSGMCGGRGSDVG